MDHSDRVTGADRWLSVAADLLGAVDELWRSRQADQPFDRGLARAAATDLVGGIDEESLLEVVQDVLFKTVFLTTAEESYDSTLREARERELDLPGAGRLLEMVSLDGAYVVSSWSDFDDYGTESIHEVGAAPAKDRWLAGSPQPEGVVGYVAAALTVLSSDHVFGLAMMREDAEVLELWHEEFEWMVPVRPTSWPPHSEAPLQG